ncbi:penicillin-binding transpeptidase domain-containing protein [Acidipropionibacterium acidipropionici]|uniref:penicillin-binding transpeptidase domain-containing protein n=1 Tax=Acidipropionibacterium acidipropionici TaxID=1748 RepID=UPI00110A65E3|nr:penicillin-binding transpeptidase domain-containing protein [Acidipropionibacterium acidipropionici]QCV96565.1 penicillin-binding protein [Acidipropionibacterium acidipropionici]
MPQNPVVSRRTFARTAAGTTVALALGGALTGCRSSADSSVPDAARQAATKLAAGLTGGDLKNVPLDDPTTAASDLKVILSGMDGLRPTTTLASIAKDGDSCTATLSHTLPLGSRKWTFTSTATLNQDGETWKTAWEPAIVHPKLGQATRLRHTRKLGERAPITGAEGKDVVVKRTVHDVGIDKANLDKTKWEASATALAKLVKIDAKTYTATVKAAGDQAFVVAITLREQDIPRNIGAIAGAQVVDRDLMLASTKTFAVGLLGTSGLADEADVKRGKGEIQEGDMVGKSGLQLRYDDQLRGKVGHVIAVVARKDATASASPAPQPTATSSASSTASPDTPQTLFSVPATDGKPLSITLDPDSQSKAEAALTSVKGVAALVAVQPGTGRILAAANSPSAGANAFATSGQYAPGSTFKIATTLALLRAGLTTSSQVNCSASVTVNGRSFHNYSDYDSSYSGSIPLVDAVAQSCNTAFISQHAKVTSAALRKAAGSLGMGTDYDTGFPSFYGKIDDTTAADVLASDMIGQGGVLASPMAMAGVAASVAAGKTVVPWLVEGHQPKPKATALTTKEVAELRQVMIATVQKGSGRVLSGLATGAKTGTAEFGESGKLRTHAWMICWTSAIAVACMVEVGESGSGTAGPLIKAFLS